MALLPQNPASQRMLMVVVVALGLGGIYHQYLGAPRGEELDAAEARVDSLESANRTAAAAARGGAVNRIIAEAAVARRELEALRLLVPASNEVPALLEEVSTAARRVGLELGSVEPLPVVTGADFDTYRYKISVAGAYHPLGEFLTNVGSLPRIIAASNLRLVPVAAAGGAGAPGAPGAPGTASGSRGTGPRLGVADEPLTASFELQTYVAKPGSDARSATPRVATAATTPEPGT